MRFSAFMGFIAVFAIASVTIGCAIATPCRDANDCPDDASCEDGACTTALPAPDARAELLRADQSAYGTFTALEPRPIVVPEEPEEPDPAPDPTPDPPPFQTLFTWDFDPDADPALACAALPGFYWRPTGCAPFNNNAGFELSLPADVTEVNGSATARASGETRAFAVNNEQIDRRYVDGLSITSGSVHIWSFAAGGYSEDGDALFEVSLGESSSDIACPCSGGAQRPLFVGDHFSCEENTDNEILWNADADDLPACRTNDPDRNIVMARVFDTPLTEPIRVRAMTSAAGLIEVTHIDIRVR